MTMKKLTYKSDILSDSPDSAIYSY